ncbi:hypothetical protein [Coleofasciculus sp. E1-EBD-02]|uniref:hypothetical protein n=1 Tax=Coleofasciculus sp. E1-EBD-02 TaxID=3068481 RepID=UPI0032F88A41
MLTRYDSLFPPQLDVYGIRNSGNLGERDCCVPTPTHTIPETGHPVSHPVTPVPISVSGISGIHIQQASHKTVKLLENHYDKIDEIEVKSNYNTQTQQINITMRSPDTRFLA